MPNDPTKKKRPSPDQAEQALHDVIEAERDRGEVNTGSEPDQKREVPSEKTDE
jgi:hypothetical protein